MNINKIFEMIDDNYNIVELRDCWDDKPVSTIFLNKKHSIDDFQDAINKSKEKHEEEISKYGNDWEYIEQENVGFYPWGLDNLELKAPQILEF